MTRSAAKASARNLTCPICLDEYVSPVVTACGHHFCEGCIRESLHRVKMECPQCRAPISSHRSLRFASELAALSSAEAAPSRLNDMCAEYVGATWDCMQCTLQNAVAASRCAACGARRPVTATAVERPGRPEAPEDTSGAPSAGAVRKARRRKRAASGSDSDTAGSDGGDEGASDASDGEWRDAPGAAQLRARTPAAQHRAAKRPAKRRGGDPGPAGGAVVVLTGMRVLHKRPRGNAPLGANRCKKVWDAVAGEWRDGPAAAGGGGDPSPSRPAAAEEGGGGGGGGAAAEEGGAGGAVECGRRRRAPPAGGYKLGKHASLMGRAEALEAARLAGLPLVPAPNSSGFRGVYYRPQQGDRFPYKVQMLISRVSTTVGAFTNAEAASLAYVRQIGAERARQAQEAYDAQLQAGPSMGAEQALEAAAREGLVLERAPGTRTGFRGVSLDPRAKAGRAFEVSFTVPGGKGRQHYLGRTATAEEGALVLARYKAEHAPPPARTGRARALAAHAGPPPASPQAGPQGAPAAAGHAD